VRSECSDLTCDGSFFKSEERQTWEAKEKPFRQADPDFEFRTPLFDLTRRLKSHPELRGLTGRQAHRAITSIMKKRHLSWEQFPAVSDGDTEFITTWDKVRYAEGDTPLLVAMREAKARPVTLSEEHEARAKYASFISFAYHLQLTVVGNILLPVRALAKVFGVSEQTISRWRHVAETDGFLIVVAQHKAGPHSRQATVFRFNVDKFDPVNLKERELKEKGGESI
jgi:hypothetical protein